MDLHRVTRRHSFRQGLKKKMYSFKMVDLEGTTGKALSGNTSFMRASESIIVQTGPSFIRSREMYVGSTCTRPLLIMMCHGIP